jgi:hypothetical protein
MNYIRVQWLHETPEAPVLAVSELDDHRWERRKVEVFADGSKGYAMKGEERGGTRLGLVPLPPFDEIAADPQFLPEEITEEEFEAIWSARLETGVPGLIR